MREREETTTTQVFRRCWKLEAPRFICTSLLSFICQKIPKNVLTMPKVVLQIHEYSPHHKHKSSQEEEEVGGK